nr:UDP-glucose/GDP-mannose dehydrogenase family protein [Cohnella sp. YIM B05605]
MFGTGYVGLVNGACLAHIGHSVLCCDIDDRKIGTLNAGRIPIYEPGLDLIVRSAVTEGKLAFTSDLAAAVERSDLLFIAVGTPMGHDGAADLRYVQAVAEFIGRHLRTPKTVVVKSTVPVGTSRKVERWIAGQMADPSVRFDVASNPEFLREGSAVSDFLNMERCIVGADREETIEEVASCFAPLDVPIHRTGRESAEMIKYAANAFLATKISFINAIANLCERMGADVEDVAEGIGSDSRIGRSFLKAGIGYGGSCFPKDTHALRWMAENAGYAFPLLEAVIRTNREQKFVLLGKLAEAVGSLQGTKIGVLGLAFKPNTDDMREAPSLDIVPALLGGGAEVRVYDPVAMEEARKAFGEEVTYASDPYEAIAGCDACLILTEWPQFLELDLDRVRELLKRPILLDGRNCFPPERMRRHFLTYYSVGREPVVFEPSEQYA